MYESESEEDCYEASDDSGVKCGEKNNGVVTYAELAERLKSGIRLNSSNERACLSCMTALSAITSMTSDSRYRCHLGDDKDILLRMIKLLKRQWRDTNVGGQVFTEIMRFLRNSTADSKSVQIMIMELPELVDLVISKLTTLAIGASQSNVDNGARERLDNSTEAVGSLDTRPSEVVSEFNGDVCAEDVNRNVQMRCSIQFLGNLVTSYDAAKIFVWPKFLSISKRLLSTPDDLTRKYATMCLYTCIVGLSEHRDELLQSNDGLELVSLIAQCVIANNGSEWALFMLEDFLNSSNFLSTYYSLLPEPVRDLLLDICYEKLRSGKDVIPAVIVFIGKQFELKADVIFTLKDVPEESLKKSSGNVEPGKVIKLLEMLCLASSMESSQKELQKCSSLLCSVTFLLRGIHLAGKEPNSIFRPGQPIDSIEPECSDDVVFGLKRDLIKLIANLCFKNKVNQDKIREFDGIPLLMDCCKLDSKNPFIMEYVIFAIRAVTEGNSENQELISKMEPLPTNPISSKVEQMPTVDVSGEIREVGTDHQQGCSSGSGEKILSKSERALQDVHDLFR